MKKLNLLLCGIIVLASASCSKESNEENGAVKGEPTSVKVTVKTNGVRSAGDISAVNALESNINTLTVLVFNGQEPAGGILGATPDGDLSVDVLNTTVGARDFIVIANAPSGEFTLSMTKSEASAKVLTLLASQASNALVMAGTGSATLVRTNDPTDNPVSVEVTRLVARVALTDVTIALDPATYPDGKFEMTRVYLNNVNTAYNVAQNAALSLVDYNGSNGWAYDFPAPATAIDDDYVPYFYVGANKILATAADAVWADGTQLVIEGNFYVDAEEDDYEVVKYPVRINRAIEGTELEGSGNTGVGVEANTIYNLSVVIKRKGGDGEDIYPAPCEVTVSVKPWVYVNQGVEF